MNLSTYTKEFSYNLKLSIPVIPGTEKPITNQDDIKNIAKIIGYPVLVKAAGGGGGKGLRIVYSSDELLHTIGRATSEAEKAFSDSRVYLEKYLENLASNHRLCPPYQRRYNRG